jgi:S-adenosylmethionine:tRNA ribosyltransferase-isomerase
MRVSDFHYPLSPDLIAQEPLQERSASRLLCLDGLTGDVEDRTFRDLPELLAPGDLVVLNDTRVLPARLSGRKESGGRVEVLIERVLGAHRARAHVRACKSPRPGTQIELEGGLHAQVLGRDGELFDLQFHDRRALLEILEQVGHVPLPPYIERADRPADRERYQTVFADRPGAVAAPTAGLHFDEALLERIRGRGGRIAFVTLHVGGGTFQPVRTERVEDHRMHAERVEVGRQVCELVATARAQDARVVAVGTTVVRSLEAAWRDGRMRPFRGEVDLFIYPGYRFQAVDALVTNFHLPGSTLLMLVCAFGGYRQVISAYRHAVRQRYRFYSYGDAMFVTAGASP